MNKLIACALFGLGLSQALVACSDDDDGGDNTSGTGGIAGTAGADRGGKDAGGSGQAGGVAGKGGSGGNAATSGSGGNAVNGGSAGSAGSVSQGGDGGSGGDTSGPGGDSSVGGDTSPGGGGAAGEGAGGAAPTEPPMKMADTYWLSGYCDAKSSESLGCERSTPWWDCFQGLYLFTSNVAEGVCAGETGENGAPKTFALVDAMNAAATACPDTTADDWRCDISGNPEPKDRACPEANQALVEAAQACTNGE